MAIAYMEKVTVPNYDARIDNSGFEYEEELDSAGNGKTIMVPDVVKSISVTLVITAGVGKVQTTTDKVTAVLSETGVTWVDWDLGEINATAQDACPPVTALRMVNSSGTTKLLIRAQ